MNSPSIRPTLDWHFPLPRTHTGILLGNGNQGLMVWGADRLCITVARAGFWDHRGGRGFAPDATYHKLRQYLEADDEPGVLSLFRSETPQAPNLPEHPQQYGAGRLELHFPDGLVPTFGQLDTSRGILTITLSNPAGRTATLSIHQPMETSLRGDFAWVEFVSADLGQKCNTKLIPAYQTVRDNAMERVGIPAPELWRDEVLRSEGFVQRLPDDAPLSLGYCLSPDHTVIALATALGETIHDQPQVRVKELLHGAVQESQRKIALQRTEQWWANYWRDVPQVQIPDAELQHAYDYGVYKQAGMTHPDAIAATLQGPWMEEYQVPPWSNDYHFNINVQMIYMPALATNRTSHLEPMWKMLRQWFASLWEQGEKFFKAPGAMLLPHAVDDRGHIIGSFWTGSIDHGCTGWMALLAWQHYRYTMDESVLRETAWPLLVGAFNGFYAMIERVTTPDGKPKLSLPVSVSPEYGASGLNAWGRDASFQLAALHRVAEVIEEAAKLIGQPIDPRWAEVREQLPHYTLIDDRDEKWRIALWEGQDLAESHRHHSHLASIYPFVSIDPYAPQHRKIVGHSLLHWNATGPGKWTGWCVPWASILCARLGLADAAVLWLHFWKRNFTNIGHGTLHDGGISGVTAWADHALLEPDFKTSEKVLGREIMQMDAGMGAISAVLELLVQCRRDGIHVLPTIPRHWRDFSFTNIGAEGAVRVGARVVSGRVLEITVTSMHGGPVRLVHTLGPTWTADGQTLSGSVYEANLAPGSTVVLRA